MIWRWQNIGQAYHYGSPFGSHCRAGRERADFSEEAAREMAKQDREPKDYLETEVWRIRMAIKHVIDATKR
jgi:hypothetical protein